MDWTRSFEDMMKTWADTQKKTWDGFFAAVQGMGAPPSARVWQQTLALGEDMLKAMLKTQAESLAAWMDSLKAIEGMPAPMLESARQFQEMSRHWTQTQAQLVESWFSMLKRFAPASPAEPWAETPQTLYKMWQETTQTIMESQAEWMRAWMTSTKGRGNE